MDWLVVSGGVLMLCANERITVYNKRNDGTWKSTLICGVSWHGESLSNVTEQGITVGRRITVRIPNESTKGFLPSTGWDGEGWTLGEGTLLLRGLGPEISRPSDLNKAGMEYVTVKLWADHRRGGLPHLKAVGV